MAKKSKAADLAVPAPYEPQTTILVTKDQAREVSVGDKVEITVSGQVVSAGEQQYSNRPTFEIRLKNVKVENIDGNGADKEIRSMTE